MMKILIVNTLYQPYKVGGAEVSVQLLAEGLVNSGHKVRVVCLHDQKIKKIDIINGVEITYLPLFNKYWPYSEYLPTKLEKLVWHLLDTYNIVMAKKVEHELLDFKPDVVHTNNIAGFSVAVWDKVKKNNIKLVHTTRDYYLFHPNCTLFKNNNIQNPDSLEVKFYSFIKKIYSKKVDYYVGISDFVKKLHIENGFFDREKSTYIYNAVKTINKTEFNSSNKKIGFIGRLSKDKGFEDFCRLAENHKNEYEFLAAGKFPNNSEGEYLRKLALENNIILLGHTEFKEFIDQVNAVVLPIKWNEPFGRVVVECAKAGVNVYTNKRGGIVELFKYFNNIKEISYKINFETSFINTNNFDYLNDKFSPDAIAKQYFDLFKEILEG